jgi:squalene-hopene/tetraprenyl-beta-curcumene cyclase
MKLQVDVERVQLARKAVRAELLSERAPAGHWVGYVASSPLATAAAVSALVAAHHTDTKEVLRADEETQAELVAKQVVQGDLCEFLLESVNWLAQHQNPDGGWGDCTNGRSSIAATMLVQAAFRLTGVPAKYDDLILRADQFVATQGGIAALRRQYREDKPFVAAILATCAIAGTIPWSNVPTLPFEQVCLPKRWQTHVQTPFHRTALPLLLAVGRAKFQHDPPHNPLMRLWRRSICTRSLTLLEQLQADDDSYLASVPTTAFVVLSLASIGCRDHRIVQRGVEFLLATVRRDASWPVETNIATTATTLVLNSVVIDPHPTNASWQDASFAARNQADDHELASSSSYDPAHGEAHLDGEHLVDVRCLDWLLAGQRTTPNAITVVAPGGWARSDAAGALPNAHDTASVLLALARLPARDNPPHRERLEIAVRSALAWLLDLQNEDGGWPTFYRRPGGFQPDESSTEVTSNVLRALAACQASRDAELAGGSRNSPTTSSQRIDAAIERGWRYLESVQRDDGSFTSRWFGNEFQPDDQNPVVGTAQVLLMCHQLSRSDWGMADRAVRWLLSSQHAGGGWGPPRAPVDYSGAEKDGFRAWRANEALAKLSSIEETALAVATLLPLAGASQPVAKAVSAGLTWVVNAIEQDAHRRPTAIGFYPSRIWYHERLYPLVFAEAALSRAVQALATERPATTHVG